MEETLPELELLANSCLERHEQPNKSNNPRLGLLKSCSTEAATVVIVDVYVAVILVAVVGGCIGNGKWKWKKRTRIKL